MKQAGRELGVRYVLEGSVRKAGGRVRITGQLIGQHSAGLPSAVLGCSMTIRAKIPRRTV